MSIDRQQAGRPRKSPRTCGPCAGPGWVEQPVLLDASGQLRQRVVIHAVAQLLPAVLQLVERNVGEPRGAKAMMPQLVRDRQSCFTTQDVSGMARPRSRSSLHFGSGFLAVGQDCVGIRATGLDAPAGRVDSLNLEHACRYFLDFEHPVS